MHKIDIYNKNANLPLKIAMVIGGAAADLENY